METQTQEKTNGATQAQVGQVVAIQPARREPLPFVPQNIDQAWRLAEVFAKASLLPDALRGKPYDVMLIIMLGAEFGLQPMTSLREIYVVKGQPRMSALLKSALVRQSSNCEYLTMIESTDKLATFETKRRGDQKAVRHTYTLEDARIAGLLDPPREGKDPGNWLRRPRLMLRRRCVSELCDEVYPDETRGFASSEDADRDRVESARVVGSSSTADPFALGEEQTAPPPPAPNGGSTPPPAGESGVAPAVDGRGSEAKENVAGATEPQKEAVLPPDPADQLLVDIKACKTIKEIDAVAARAKAITGPRRGDVGKALNEQRALVKGG